MMASTNDSSPRSLAAETKTEDNTQTQQWIESLENLMQAVQRSSLDIERKAEILVHMEFIRAELSAGRWPTPGSLDSPLNQVANEMGEVERIARDWKVLSIRLAEWIKTISDSLGVR